MRRPLIICLLLFAVTLGAYGPVRQNDFIYYDDPQFIMENEVVKAGLTGRGLVYAFTQPVVGNWHPVTTLSHMLDCQLFGVDAGAHHLVNAAIHAANAVLVFLLLFQMTGSMWRSLAVAALFALHPLRVESVAWASERKDVLCAFFGLLCLMAYAKYAQVKSRGLNPSPDRSPHPVPLPLGGGEGGRRTGEGAGLRFNGRSISSEESLLDRGGKGQSRQGLLWYWVAFFCLALGLMSKAMLVTWPFVMLLLDVWPLRRIGPSVCDFQCSNLKQLFIEKLPFLALCLIFCAITLIVQHDAGAVSSTVKIPILERLVNAVMSCVRYLGHTLWPTKLAVIYPHPAVFYATAERWPVWLVGLSALGLVVISFVCLRWWKTRPYLAVGWFWYLGTLVPVLGLVQVGEQAMADRYTYLPMIGPVFAAVWALADLTAKLSYWRALLIGLGTAALLLCMAMTRQQLSYWRNTVTLFERTLKVTSANPSAHFAVGTGLERSADLEGAIRQYQAAIAIDPGYKKAHYNLGQLFKKQQRWREAAVHYRAVLEVDPKDVPSHLNLAATLSAQGQTGDAIAQYNEALRRDTNSLEAMNNLAWALATSPEAKYRDGAKAVQFGLRACELSSNSIPTIVGTLAAAYAEAGQYSEAINTAEKARDLAAAQGQADAVRKNEELLELYRAGKAYREGTQ